MKVTNKHYELNGVETSRVIANFIRWKMFPFGNVSDGPGLVWLFTLWFRHKYGRLIAGYKIRKASRRKGRAAGK